MSRQHDATVENNETYPKKSGGGRGFFAALMLCLIAVGGVAVTTFSDSLQQPPLDTEQNSTTVTTAVTTTTAKPVAVTPVTTTTKVSTTTTAATTTTTKAASLFALPLSNKVLTPYSEEPVYNATLDTYRAHTAIDFDGEEGQRVRPFANGVVTAVEQDALWGGCVTIDHGAGVISVYRGIEPSVEVGDELTTDNHLGALADVPCESDLGPHLHFELYKEGKAADAAALFDKQLSYE